MVTNCSAPRHDAGASRVKAATQLKVKRHGRMKRSSHASALGAAGSTLQVTVSPNVGAPVAVSYKCDQSVWPAGWCRYTVLRYVDGSGRARAPLSRTGDTRADTRRPFRRRSASRRTTWRLCRVLQPGKGSGKRGAIADANAARWAGETSMPLLASRALSETPEDRVTISSWRCASPKRGSHDRSERRCGDRLPSSTPRRDQ